MVLWVAARGNNGLSLILQCPSSKRVRGTSQKKHGLPPFFREKKTALRFMIAVWFTLLCIHLFLINFFVRYLLDVYYSAGSVLVH